MHDDEVAIDGDLVTGLIAAQFPALRGRRVRAVESTGTVNAIFRVGEDVYARLPRLAGWADALERERQWLPAVARCVPLTVPRVVGRGEPADGYPFPWAVYEWIDGEPYADGLVRDESEAALDLAAFVRALRGMVIVEDAPRGGRAPLAELNEVTREALSAAGYSHAAWERALDAPAWDGADPVWVHADLLRPNLLVRDGRIGAVIDFGAIGVGDPAADVIAAWAVFGPAGRAAYREALEVDDGTWERARGFALHQAALIIPYYARTNPRFSALARRTIEQLLLPA